MTDPTPYERELTEMFADDVAALIKAVPPAHRDRVQQAFGNIFGMLLALRRKVQRLEAKRTPTYKGVWTADAAYDEADLCTYGGSLWIALSPTTARPSTHDSLWKLCVKAGRDGRDGKDLRTDADTRRIRPVTAHPDDPDARPRA